MKLLLAAPLFASFFRRMVNVFLAHGGCGLRRSPGYSYCIRISDHTRHKKASRFSSRCCEMAFRVLLALCAVSCLRLLLLVKTFFPDPPMLTQITNNERKNISAESSFFCFYLYIELAQRGGRDFLWLRNLMTRFDMFSLKEDFEDFPQKRD